MRGKTNCGVCRPHPINSKLSLGHQVETFRTCYSKLFKQNDTGLHNLEYFLIYPHFKLIFGLF